MSSNTPLPAVNSAASAVALLSGNKVQQTVGGGVPFLKFDAKRTGEWLFGVEAEPCTGDVFSLDVSTLQHGQILWHNKKANRLMVPINQDLPEPQEPIHYTDNKGKPQVDEANEARSFEGSFEDGVKFILEVSTFGGRKAIDALLAELFTRAGAGSPFLFPQVKLDSSSYEHSQYGKVFQPELVAVAWFDESGNQEPADNATLAAPAEEPEPEPEPEPEQKAPAKRRRRTAAA